VSGGGWVVGEWRRLGVGEDNAVDAEGDGLFESGVGGTNSC
jgi:hypothetical protein